MQACLAGCLLDAGHFICDRLSRDSLWSFTGHERRLSKDSRKNRDFTETFLTLTKIKYLSPQPSPTQVPLKSQGFLWDSYKTPILVLLKSHLSAGRLPGL